MGKALLMAEAAAPLPPSATPDGGIGGGLCGPCGGSGAGDPGAAADGSLRLRRSVGRLLWPSAPHPPGGGLFSAHHDPCGAVGCRPAPTAAAVMSGGRCGLSAAAPALAASPAQSVPPGRMHPERRQSPAGWSSPLRLCAPLYDSFFRDTAPAPPENPSVIFDRAAEQVCRSCVLCAICWQQNYNATYNAFNDACRRCCGTAQPEDFPLYFTARCVHLRSLSPPSTGAAAVPPAPPVPSTADLLPAVRPRSSTPRWGICWRRPTPRRRSPPARGLSSVLGPASQGGTAAVRRPAGHGGDRRDAVPPALRRHGAARRPTGRRR